MRNGFLRSLLERVGEKSIFIYDDPYKDGLNYWRERILLTVLAVGTALSALALIPSVYMIWNEKRWTLLFADSIAFVLAGCLLVFKRIGLRLRAMAVLLLTFLIGVFIVVELGFTSGGPLGCSSLPFSPAFCWA